MRGRQVQTVQAAGPSTGVVMEAAQGMVQRTGHEAAAGLKLDRAGMALRPAEWLVLRTTIALGTAVLLLLLGRSVWWGLLGVLLAVAVTEAYVRLKVRRRLRAFERQLPDVLTLVASSLATGFSLHQSLDAVAQDASDPVSTELYRALAETRIGADLDRRAGPAGRSDEQREHALDNDGHPHPAAGGWQPRGDAADDGHHAARA